MATVYVTIGQVGTRSLRGEVDVYLAGTTQSEVITSGASAVDGNIIGGSLNRGFGADIAQIYCDTAVWVSTDGTDAATPAGSPATTTSAFVPGGSPTFLTIAPGAAVSVIDA